MKSLFKPNSLSTRFQIPIILGIMISMGLSIIVMSNEINGIAVKFSELTRSKLDHEHRELESTITESLRLKSKALGNFMSKSSMDYILSLDLVALRELQNEASQDPDVVYAIFFKPDNTPFLSKKVPDLPNIYKEKYEITHHQDVLGYVELGMSKTVIEKKKQLATDYNTRMLESLQATTDTAIEKFTNKSVIFIFSLTIVLTIFIYIVFYNFISHPIHKLATHVKEIGHGNLDKKVDLNSNDEIGELAKTFNTMAESLKDSYDKLYKTNTELVEATIAKDHFMANMTHELRTPLNAVIGLSGLLFEDSGNKPEDMEKLKLINEAGIDLLTIIEHILEITTIQSGKLEVFPINFEIDSILNELHTVIEKSLSSSGNTFTLSIDKNITDMTSDPAKIKEILISLLVNADKFTKNGRIVLSVMGKNENDTSWIEFRVSDTGIGIEKELQEKIFDPFYQADETITRRYSGAGLGLAISKRYCISLGGTITVQSKLNTGSEFFVTLPRYMSIDEDKDTSDKLTGT